MSASPQTSINNLGIGSRSPKESCSNRVIKSLQNDGKRKRRSKESRNQNYTIPIRESPPRPRSTAYHPPSPRSCWERRYLNSLIWIDGRPPYLHNREIDWSVFPENTEKKFNSLRRRCLSNDGGLGRSVFPLFMKTSACCAARNISTPARDYAAPS